MMTDQPHPMVLLESFSKGPFANSYRFEGLQATVIARSQEEVIPALAEVERAVSQGSHAAGFVSYEAASALNLDLSHKTPATDQPLVWFGIFKERHSFRPDNEAGGVCEISPLRLNIQQKDYVSAIESIKAAISAGETYQVNFTTRQHFDLLGDPLALYRRMCRNQKAPFCAWIDTGSQQILSASPELFFSLKDRLLTMKPMKGTAARLPDADADRLQRAELAASVKDQAENLMIVDLVRNDLAIIAETGSVQVPALFEVETFPTVHQMTSTVTATIKPETGLVDVFKALFPCGSVTGAPKRRTMNIIEQLEVTARGVYCGAIGYLSPGLEAVFSVAIRTAVLDSSSGKGEIGIGSGITWGSDAEEEFRECLVKSAFMSRESSDFQLIESLRHDPEGYLMIERHLQRLKKSAGYFGFDFDEADLRARLSELASGLTGNQKVRLLLSQDGYVSLEAQPIAEISVPGLLAVSQQQIDSNDPFLYHKTTKRKFYDDERRRHPECYDVIFLNERHELTEGSFNNLVLSLQGQLLTPSLSSGLLPGVLRAELIESGKIREAVLTLADLHAAEKIWLINSVRGWRECVFSKNR